MNIEHKKNDTTTRTAPTVDAAILRALAARAWKPEASSLKREDWRRIVLERLG